MSDFKLMPIWMNAFSPRENDIYEAQRTRLANCLVDMRQNVGQLLTMVPSDCRDLTIHDVTHLDAVFEMASTIAGERFELNPAEAFVLFGAILIHDAGLTSASYKGGLSQIKETIEWKDVAAAHLRQAGYIVDPGSLNSPPSDLLPSIIFSVLRALHAKQAEHMASTPWSDTRGNSLYLINDQELKDAFASTIGRVAHSHHWSIHRVAEELSDNVGAGTVLPIEWAVSERKVACLLRCADACHIDRRRAPSMLYAATKPKGTSAVHWDAQNKINKPTLNKSSMVFSSGRPFEYEEADAWWLVYDLVKLADQELRASNSLLQDLGHKDFIVQRVYGAENPSLLAKSVRTNGWKPVDAEVRVSDPVALAKSLGGSRLYGELSLAPIRELLQNAADAVRARRSLEQRDKFWGEINLTFEADPNNPEGCILHVDDSGIGMSERVMAGPLIDFGKSIWNSGLLREEYPGLESSFHNPVGKFGIGFFSIFDLASRVTVISKRHIDGQKDAKALEFKDLSHRPVMRPAAPKELPVDVSTRVTLYLDNYQMLLDLGSLESPFAQYEEIVVTEQSVHQRILSLIASLDIRVKFEDSISNDIFDHKPDLVYHNPSAFLTELYGSSLEQKRLEDLKRRYDHRIKPILDDDSGELLGIGAIGFELEDQSISRHVDRSFSPKLSVGGFTIGIEHYPIVGVLFGATNNVSRKDGFSNFKTNKLRGWSSEQAELVLENASRYRVSELMLLARQVVEYGGDPKDLPFCWGSSGLMTYNSFRSQVLSLDKVLFPFSIDSDYADNYTVSFNSYADYSIDYSAMKLLHNVFINMNDQRTIVDKELGNNIVTQNPLPKVKRDEIVIPDALQNMISVIEAEWKVTSVFGIEETDIFEKSFFIPERTTFVLSVSKPR